MIFSEACTEYSDIARRRECLWALYTLSTVGQFCADWRTETACDWAANNIARGLRLAALMAACEQRGFRNGYDAACYELTVGGA